MLADRPQISIANSETGQVVSLEQAIIHARDHEPRHLFPLNPGI